MHLTDMLIGRNLVDLVECRRMAIGWLHGLGSIGTNRSRRICGTLNINGRTVLSIRVAFPHLGA